LELPKVPKEKPAGGAALWAWLFVNAKKLDKVPDDLPQGPFREAMELAKEASFSVGELEAYHKVLDEIQQAREYGEEKEAAGLAKGLEKGLVEGHKSGLAEGKSSALLTILGARGLVVSDIVRERIMACKDAALLDKWITSALTAQSVNDVFGFE
jgi:flagellar biosynthesis/type III secretory pathway protein FliH